jgi:hypothetical protein
MSFMSVTSLPGYEVQDLGSERDFAEFIRTASIEELAQERSRMETLVEGLRGRKTHFSEVVEERMQSLDRAIELDNLVESWMS